jgi:hypothetical protein
VRDEARRDLYGYIQGHYNRRRIIWLSVISRLNRRLVRDYERQPQTLADLDSIALVSIKLRQGVNDSAVHNTVSKGSGQLFRNYESSGGTILVLPLSPRGHRSAPFSISVLFRDHERVSG